MSLLLIFLMNFAHAMDAFEYQVYDAEIDKPGEYSLETHLNVAGSKTPEEQSEILPSNHLTHLTFEFARGMTPNWELGAYLQTAISSDGISRYAGSKLRSKFVWTRGKGDRFSFGLNFELSNVPPEFESNRWGSEVRPIFGYANDHFIFLVNPIVDVSLTQGSSSQPDISPAAKIVFNTHHGFGIGAEYYTEFGELNHLVSFNRAEQYALATFDLLDGPVELNFGVGPGLNDDSNDWLAKGIFGFVF